MDAMCFPKSCTPPGKGCMLPLTCRQPNVVGGLSVAGIVLFSGSCYAAALTEESSMARFAPYGCGWSSHTLVCNVL